MVKNKIIPMSAKAINCVKKTEKIIIIFLFLVLVIFDTFRMSKTISLRLLKINYQNNDFIRYC